MSHVTGADGHACLLRAMCEASATPLHDEGLLGDAVNFLLTANYATKETDEKLKEYVAAQAQGQVNKTTLYLLSMLWHEFLKFQLSQECFSYQQYCPVSFFKYIDDVSPVV